jgi:isopentenyldiphosphate isomerase
VFIKSWVKRLLNSEEFGIFMDDELIDIFDGNNKPVGKTMLKRQAHENGEWHRAAHVWIYNSKGEVLLQLRGKGMELFPGRWDISSAGHVMAGETVVAAAIREVHEELGILAKEASLEPFKVMKISIDHLGLKNREFIYIFTMRFDGKAGSLKIQKEELDGVRFLNTDFVRQDYLKNPSKYTPGKGYWMNLMELIENKAAILQKEGQAASSGSPNL